jgi:hypothetical protein
LEDKLRLSTRLGHQNNASPPSHLIICRLQIAIALIKAYALIQRVHMQGDVCQSRSHGVPSQNFALRDGTPKATSAMIGMDSQRIPFKD